MIIKIKFLNVLIIIPGYVYMCKFWVAMSDSRCHITFDLGDFTNCEKIEYGPKFVNLQKKNKNESSCAKQNVRQSLYI